MAERLYEEELREKYEADMPATAGEVEEGITYSISGDITGLPAALVNMLFTLVCMVLEIILTIGGFIISLVLMGGIMLGIFYYIPKWVFTFIFGM